MENNYFKGMSDKEISEYIRGYWIRWIVAASIFFGSWGVISSILWLFLRIFFDVGFQFCLFVSMVPWALLIKNPLKPDWWSLWDYLTGQTKSDEIAIYRNDWRLKKEKHTPSDKKEYEPLSGFRAVPPRTLHARYPWEVLEATLNVAREVLLSNKDLDEVTNTIYSKDKKTVFLGWLLNLAPLLTSMKYVVNQLRYGITEAERHKFFKEQVLTFVAAALHEWAKPLSWDPVGDTDKEISLTKFKVDFENFFLGAELHELEMKLGCEIIRPQGTSCTLSRDLQKSQENEGRLKTAVLKANEAFDKAGGEKAGADYAMLLQQSCAALGIPVPQGINFTTLRVKGDEAVIGVLAAQLAALTASGNSTRPTSK